MRLFWPTVDMLLEVPAWTPPFGAALRPEWFRPLGPVPKARGLLTFNTRTLEVSGAGVTPVGGVIYQQDPMAPEIAVFCFAGGTLAGDVIIRGARPAAILFAGDAFVSACVDARAAGARAGGPGLGAHPGGGGGFGGSGGPSREAEGGRSYGLREAFEVGSGGQSGSSSGGLGGGGLQLGATGSLQLFEARVRVDGFDGRAARDGTAGGGGSGGALSLHARDVRLDPGTRLSVQGGAGGVGLGAGHGGGGGAGGYVLGVTADSGTFDPAGADVRFDGGSGGRAVGTGRDGAPGGCGVTFLAGRRQPVRPPARVQRPTAWAWASGAR